MSYVTVFEITHEAIPLWFPFSFVLFSLFGVIFFLGTRDDWGFTKWFFRSFVLLFACLWLFFSAYFFLDRKHHIEAYQRGKYKVVEGSVERYSWKGKSECFSVHGVEFCHGTANPLGWDPPLRLGPATWPVGLINKGLPVRVAYSDGPIPLERSAFPLILRLDVGTATNRQPGL